MTSELLALLPELFELLAFGVGSLGLSVAGLYIERFAIAVFESGNAKLGAWIALLGAMAFYFAYLMATDKFRPKLASLRRRHAE
ncbi:hypothetical protein [Haloplanus halobius]|uniref:hypothetical protein n=1 Tax=Haloplanus halobius TaxID=2934938 RepID=UPI00200DE34F|nr:hypothetical protein [Haloplanus sp. XH21]